MSRDDRTVRRVLLAILLLAFALRVARLDFDEALPYLAHPDEPTQYNTAARILRTGDLNPQFFNYPSLHAYLCTAAFAAATIGSDDGRYPIEIQQVGIGLVPSPKLMLLGRFLSVVAGTIGVWILFLLVRRFAVHRWTPLLAAGLLAISTEHVRLSHYMTVDVLASTLVLGALAALAAAVARSEPRLALWGTALAGLAASTKYNYGVACLAAAAAAWLVGGTPRTRLLRILGCAAVFSVALIAASPYLLLDLPAAWAGIRREMVHYGTGHVGVAGNAAVAYLQWLGRSEPVALLLAPFGAWLAWRRDRRALVPVLAFAIPFALLIGTAKIHFERNALSLLALMLGAAALTGEALLHLVRGRVREIRLAIGALVALALILPSAILIPGVLSGGPSARARAQVWIDRAEEIPEAAALLDRNREGHLKILAEGYTVFLRPEEVDVSYRFTLSDHGLDAYLAHGFDLIVTGSGMRRRFLDARESFPVEAARYDELLERLTHTRYFETRQDPLQYSRGDQIVTFFVVSPKGQRFVALLDASGGDAR